MSEGGTVDETCEQLLDDINRWRPELQAGIRSTLWHGIFARALQEVEALVRTCASTMLTDAGEEGQAAVRAVGGGKPLAAMTMGEHVGLVRKLGDNRLGRGDRQRLDRLNGLRRDFVHGRLPREEGPAKTLEFLSLAEEFCRSRFIVGLRTAP